VCLIVYLFAFYIHVWLHIKLYPNTLRLAWLYMRIRSIKSLTSNGSIFSVHCARFGSMFFDDKATIRFVLRHIVIIYLFLGVYMSALNNKVAIITGASSGIGYASAKLFAKKGAKVVLAARRRDELEKLAKTIHQQGGEAVSLAGDVCEEEYAEALVQYAVAEFGGLDIAFNNAGTLGALGKATTDTTYTDWQHTIHTNLTSAFFAAKYQLPEMMKRGGGSMIFTSSFVGHTVGMPQMAAYAASKAGLVGLTQALATEYGANGIRVNALLPGGTDTAMGRSVANSPEAVSFVEALHALKRMAFPEEIAQSALFLASDASSFTTGTALLADGGVSICRT